MRTHSDQRSTGETAENVWMLFAIQAHRSCLTLMPLYSCSKLDGIRSFTQTFAQT